MELFISTHADFPYLADLKQTQALGWLEQEQTIDLFT